MRNALVALPAFVLFLALVLGLSACHDEESMQDSSSSTTCTVNGNPC